MYFLNGQRVIVTCASDCINILSDAGVNDTSLINQKTIALREVLRVSVDECTLTIQNVIHENKRKLKIRSLTLSGCSEDIVTLEKAISAHISDRPKRLLVIVNPNSGKSKALKIYEKYAAPLFKDCDINADVWVTQKPKEPTEILNNYDLFHVNGIVAVGGDGIFCECINGLITRIQRDHGIDPNNPKTEIIPASLPIGIIPAGSGDIIAQYLYGTRCPGTAVLHILLGNQVFSNLVSVHEGGRLLSYSALVLGFGLFGDMMNDCESFRWMGPTRYNIVPLVTMLKRREIEVEVEYFPFKKEESPKRARLCGYHISLPNGFLDTSILSQIHRAKSTAEIPYEHKGTEETESEEGRVYAVDSHAITMKEKSGRMTPYFGQDSLMVYVTHKCSLSDHISQLTKVKNEKPDCYDFKFVSKHSVSGYRVNLTNSTVTNKDGKKVLQKHYYINCDGEAIRLTEPSFDVKLHRKVIMFFGEPSDTYS